MNTTTNRWVLVATILASSMAFIDGTALNVALPALQADLGASGAELLWIVNAYLLMLASLTLVGGALGDRLGRKRVFAIGIGLFLLASLACGAAPNPRLLIAARAIQGIGGALMIPGSLAIISASFSSNERGRAIGIWSSATTLVTIAGPILGGVLADAGLWRGVFLINLPVGLAALLVLRVVPESRAQAQNGPLDYPGALLTVFGLAGLTYAFLTAPDLGFASPQVWLPLFGGVLALVVFVVVEARSPNPMMPLFLFRSPTFSGANLLTLLLYGALNVGMFFLSLNLVQAQGYSQSLAGLAQLPFVLLLAFLSRAMGGLADRFGPRLLLTVGPALAGVGFLLMSLIGQTGGPAEYWVSFLPAMLVFGLGMAITVTPLTATVMGAAPAQYAGTTSGINNAVARTAGVLAIAIVGGIALSLFAAQLDARTSQLGLPAATLKALQAQANRLGAAEVPADVASAARPAVAGAIKAAFIDTYRVVEQICAGLAFGAALAAALLVSPRKGSTAAP